MLNNIVDNIEQFYYEEFILSFAMQSKMIGQNFMS